MIVSESSSNSEAPAKNKVPYGVRLIQLLPRPRWLRRIVAYRLYIFILTYLLYVSYHIVRRPLLVVKNVLAAQNCPATEPEWGFQHLNHNISETCAWEPFDIGSKTKFAALDFTYRFSYVFGLLAAGHIGERMDLRLFITIVMMVAGFWVIFQGMAYFWNIHMYSYFVVAQVLCGLTQGSGWPSVLSVMGNWFGREKRGLILGIWNTDTSVGNILGSLISGVWVDDQWGYCFIVPGLLIAGGGILAFLLIIEKPVDIGLPPSDYEEKKDPTTHPMEHNASEMVLTDETVSAEFTIEENLEPPEATTAKKPVTLWGALLIPGVVEFSLCLFFNKAVFYAFFFWLPVYIKEAAHAKNEAAADLSTLYDAGGIIGGILAGALSDVTSCSATICGVMFLLAIPAIYCLEAYVTHGTSVLVGLLIIIGLLLNGPYTLITTAVATDLGTRPGLVGNKKSMTTVIAIIDSVGSLGSALGPLGAGLLSAYGWQAVFYYLIAMQLAATATLLRLIYREIREFVRHINSPQWRIYWLQRWNNLAHWRKALFFLRKNK